LSSRQRRRRSERARFRDNKDEDGQRKESISSQREDHENGIVGNGSASGGNKTSSSSK
jgi:hypothetical protein